MLIFHTRTKRDFAVFYNLDLADFRFDEFDRHTAGAKKSDFTLGAKVDNRRFDPYFAFASVDNRGDFCR